MTVKFELIRQAGKSEGKIIGASVNYLDALNMLANIAMNATACGYPVRYVDDVDTGIVVDAPLYDSKSEAVEQWFYVYENTGVKTV